MYNYLVPYTFIAGGRFQQDANLILSLTNRPIGDELQSIIEHSFENFFNDAEMGCDRDGCVCFYNAGEVSIQFSLDPIEIPISVFLWMEKHNVARVVKI